MLRSLISEKPHRRPLRLRGYDYAQEGAYYVTVCVQNRQCLLGEAVEESIRLNEAGEMVARWWQELGHKFPNVVPDAWVVMPNHVHGVVVIGPDTQARAATQGRPYKATLGDVMDWFKTMTTNEYLRGVKGKGWKPVVLRLWQRNYYEHIVRNGKELDRIRRYIADNPARWDTDQENPEAKGRSRRGVPTGGIGVVA